MFKFLRSRLLMKLFVIRTVYASTIRFGAHICNALIDFTTAFVLQKVRYDERAVVLRKKKIQSIHGPGKPFCHILFAYLSSM